MNRREILSSLVGVVAGAGLPGTVTAVEQKPGNPLECLVLTLPADYFLSEESAEAIQASFKKLGINAPMVVCPPGASLTPVYRSGSAAKYHFRYEVDGAAIDLGFDTKAELDEYRAVFFKEGEA